MEIRISKSDLNKVLGVAIRAIPNKTSTPVLEGFLMEHKDNVLRVTATDMEITIVAKTPCEGNSGTACIPAKTLIDLVKTLPDTEISLKVEGGRANVDWGKGSSEFPAFEVADFPEIKKVNGEQTSVAREDLRTAIKHALPNVSEDILRPALGGILFDPKDEVVNLVASDSHTLAIYPIPGKIEHQFILPGKAAAFIKDNLGGEGRVGITVDDNSVALDLDGIEVYSRTIVGKFPKYESVIPQNNGCELKGNIAEFKSVINRISSCANKASKFIKFTLDMMGVVIEGQDLGFNCSAREELDNFIYNGEKIVVGFRFDYLLKLLSAFDGDEVTMKFADGRRAALVTTEGNPCEAIIMPVQIQ